MQCSLVNSPDLKCLTAVARRDQLHATYNADGSLWLMHTGLKADLSLRPPTDVDLFDMVGPGPRVLIGTQHLFLCGSRATGYENLHVYTYELLDEGSFRVAFKTSVRFTGMNLCGAVLCCSPEDRLCVIARGREAKHLFPFVAKQHHAFELDANFQLAQKRLFSDSKLFEIASANWNTGTGLLEIKKRYSFYT